MSLSACRPYRRSRANDARISRHPGRAAAGIRLVVDGDGLGWRCAETLHVRRISRPCRRACLSGLPPVAVRRADHCPPGHLRSMALRPALVMRDTHGTADVATDTA